MDTLIRIRSVPYIISYVTGEWRGERWKKREDGRGERKEEST
jgi:hypothetical protein